MLVRRYKPYVVSSRQGFATQTLKSNGFLRALTRMKPDLGTLELHRLLLEISGNYSTKSGVLKDSDFATGIE